jgi:hypothetical protein
MINYSNIFFVSVDCYATILLHFCKKNNEFQLGDKHLKQKYDMNIMKSFENILNLYVAFLADEYSIDDFKYIFINH